MELYSIIISKYTFLNPKRLLWIYLFSLVILFISVLVVIFIVGRKFADYGIDNLKCEAIYLTTISSIFLFFNFIFGFIFLKKLSKFSYSQSDSALFKKLALFLLICLTTFFIHSIYLLFVDFLKRVIRGFLVFFELTIFFFFIKREKIFTYTFGSFTLLSQKSCQ